MKKIKFIISFATALLISTFSFAKGIEITGAGASFPAPIYTKWAEAYSKVSGDKLNYASIGSGGGVKQIKEKTVDFGATDNPLKGDDLAQSNMVQFPAIIGGIVVIFNLEGFKPQELVIDGDTTSKIFAGEITKWNDKQIAALNPGKKLPDQEITVVTRSDSSGTTAIFTDYLSTVNAMWKEKIGKGSSFAAAWEGLFATLEYTAVMEQHRGTEITIDWQSGEESVHSAAEIWKIIFDSNHPWILSANGTIFTYEKEGIIPGLLKRWYAERKEMQAKLKECKTKEDEEYWDKRQLVKKINLNSLYGAILNPGCRFFDKRIGQSTTLTGRSIAKHMDAYVNECIFGKYDHTGDSIIYGDTDSCYFSAWNAVKEEVNAGRMEWNKDTAIALYNSIADQVNNSFPSFMEQAFHCPREMGSVIKGGREIVASRGLFITKKRYAVMYYDKDGKRYDVQGKPGKVKAMGLDLKRSDTPKVIQEFLSDILNDVLQGAEKNAVVEKIREFKYKFTERPGWEKGSPKRVNNLTKYSAEEARLGKANMPGHVRAAMNWNQMRRMNSDNYSMQVVDGMKTIVCKLKPNALGWTSIGYPTDELHLPQWFKDLPFDDSEMEATVVDQKIDNLLSVLNWDLASATNTENTFQTLFEF